MASASKIISAIAPFVTYISHDVVTWLIIAEFQALVLFCCLLSLKEAVEGIQLSKPLLNYIGQTSQLENHCYHESGSLQCNYYILDAEATFLRAQKCPIYLGIHVYSISKST